MVSRLQWFNIALVKVLFSTKIDYFYFFRMTAYVVAIHCLRGASNELLQHMYSRRNIRIKALTALVGRLSQSVDGENGSERQPETVSINPVI